VSTLHAKADVAMAASPINAASIDWVGMENIDALVHFQGLSLPAKLSASVDLKRADARGIHMSRLYLLADQLLTEHSLRPDLLRRLLAGFLHSHSELSERARLTINFDLPLRRQALASGLSGWRHYPVLISAEQSADHIELSMQVRVLYSSTCPCSAALARELHAQAFAEQFNADAPLDRQTVLDWLQRASNTPTPHAQRSALDARVSLHDYAAEFEIPELIDQLEAALQTPVQTAVKRVDEQAFTQRNGQNLMFVEDAIRRAATVLRDFPDMRQFHAKTAHWESLHAHDAVAEISG
jgi:GTP cyclohydrolase IB